MTSPKNSDPEFTFAPRVTLPVACDPAGSYFWVIDAEDEDRVYGFMERVLLRSSISPRTGKLSTVWAYIAYTVDERIVARDNGSVRFDSRAQAARVLRNKARELTGAPA